MIETDYVLVRETTGVCPECHAQCPAVLIEKDGRIIFEKKCPRHNSTPIVLSDSPVFYRELDRFYFNVMDEDKRPLDLTLYVTGQCNMRCTICGLSMGDESCRLGEPSLEEIRRFDQESKWPFVIISGGEPTCREDIPEIIGLLRRSGKAVSLNTNGVRLADRDYVLRLKKAGLHRVNLQFDGFLEKTDKRLGRHGFLDQKMRALANLDEAGLSTALNTVVVRGINDHTLMDMLSFMASQSHIASINFLTVNFLGNAGDHPTKEYLMPDQVVDKLVRDSKGLFKKENIFLFQKFHLALKSLCRQRFCLYSQIYVAVRDKAGYLPIDAFLNFRHLDFWLRKYELFYKKSRIMSAAFLFLGAISLLLSKRSWQIVKELILLGASYLARGGKYLRPSKFFYINFTTGCDPYKIDYSIVKNCHSQLACASSRTEPLKYQGRTALWYIKREKEKSERIS